MEPWEHHGPSRFHAEAIVSMRCLGGDMALTPGRNDVTALPRLAWGQPTAMSSTSKTNVALGGIAPGNPRAP